MAERISRSTIFLFIALSEPQHNARDVQPEIDVAQEGNEGTIEGERAAVT